MDGPLSGTSVFGTVAEAYRRPPIPESAVDWLTCFAPDRAVDVAAGTGAFTAKLTERIREVVAVEPDPGMRAVAGRRCPDVPVLAGTAEHLPVADASVDAVFASSAWHWFDAPAAIAEAARVLRPGGTLGVLWGVRDRTVPWIVQLDRIVRLDHSVFRGAPGDFAVPKGAPFSAPERMVLSWNWRVDPDDLIASLGTYSHVIRLPEDERAEVLRTAREYIAARPPVDGQDVIEVPVRTICWRTRRMK